jgi:ketosteroid isomerase-like protein
MTSNRDIISQAFDDWSTGTGHVSSIFADDMTWEIVGHSVASRKYASAAEFIAEVLQPFGARFSTTTPFRPVVIRQVIAEGDRVVVLWDGEGETIAGTTYRNTYAWFMTLNADGKIADGTAFYDSISFNELWNSVVPPAGR